MVTSSICDYKLNARMCIRGVIAITGSAHVCVCVSEWSVVFAVSLFFLSFFLTERLCVKDFPVVDYA